MAVQRQVLRLDLTNVEKSLMRVEESWQSIDVELNKRRIGGKLAFTGILRGRMMTAYEYLGSMLEKEVAPFSEQSMSAMVELNNLVHYGRDMSLRQEYAEAIRTNLEQYNDRIIRIAEWYKLHMIIRPRPQPIKTAAEVYVAVLSSRLAYEHHPWEDGMVSSQLFNEGNHRTGSMISSWISMYFGHPPFVLSPENAIDYFQPSHDIKMSKKYQLPKYRRQFKEFWEAHIDWTYVVESQRPSELEKTAQEGEVASQAERPVNDR